MAALPQLPLSGLKVVASGSLRSTLKPKRALSARSGPRPCGSIGIKSSRRLPSWSSRDDRSRRSPPVACLVEFETFKKNLAYLRERQGGQPTTALLGLARTLKAIAKHQGLAGEPDVARIGRICATYARDLENYNPKSRDRLQNFEDERLLGALMHLPERLLEEAGLPRTSPRKAKILAQIAIAVEIEWHTPLRLANLVALNLRQNIQAITVKGKTRWIIRFDRHETKNRSLLIHELPAESVRQIERALRFYDQTNGWLFPGAKGFHKLSSLFGKQSNKKSSVASVRRSMSISSADWIRRCRSRKMTTVLRSLGRCWATVATQ